MEAQDVSQNPKVARIAKLTHDLEQSPTPDHTLRALLRGFAEVGEPVASLLLSTRGLRPHQYRVIQMPFADRPQDGVLDPDGEELSPVRCGGIMPALIAGPGPRLIQEVDWSRDPFFHETLREYSSAIAVPVSAARLPMNWLLLLKKAPPRFTVSDMENAFERTALGGALLEKQMLAADLARAHAQIDREARKVGELQRALLPASLPQIAGLWIAASYEPSSRAGGDLYDFFPLDERNERYTDPAGAGAPSVRWCVLIADAAGHGLAAAVVIAIVQAVLRARPAGVVRPATLLMHANRQLCGKRLGGFVTAFLGVYEPAARRLTYANAGHPPPLVRRSSDGSVRSLNEVGSHPLGIDEDETFKEAAVQFGRGDTVLLYTDGITEARGTAADDFFGEGRLARVLCDAPDGAAELIDRLRRAVLSHEGGQAPVDDQTLVAAGIL